MKKNRRPGGWKVRERPWQLKYRGGGGDRKEKKKRLGEKKKNWIESSSKIKMARRERLRAAHEGANVTHKRAGGPPIMPRGGGVKGGIGAQTARTSPDKGLFSSWKKEKKERPTY